MMKILHTWKEERCHVLRALLREEAVAAFVEEAVTREYLKKEEDFGKNLRIVFTLAETTGMNFGFRNDSVGLAGFRDRRHVAYGTGRLYGCVEKKWFGPVIQ